MSAQPVFEAHVPADRPLTWEDLQSIPDDQHWAYELVEGSLLVSPSPDSRHQTCVLELAVLLRQACPDDLQVFVAPFDWVPRAGYSLQPDLLVAPRTHERRRRLEVTPALVVEVLSPSSRATDRALKRLVYEEHGVASYWIVDPDTASVLVLELEDGGYVERAHASADEELHVTHPFPVSLVPSRLVAE